MQRMTSDAEKPTKSSSRSGLRCRTHGKFTEWLANSGGSLAITTYTSGKLVLVTTDEGRLCYRTLKFARPMGIAYRKERLALAVQKRILLFQKNGKGKFTLKREYETDRVDAHDIAFGRRGIYFANTRYNCIARAVPEKRFLRNWKPPFVPDNTQRDHCHLNGLGLLEGRPAMATAFCATDKKGGWREDDRFTKGILINIPENQIVAEGLCMPHSPRWYRDRWWLCDSGHGTLSVFDEASQQCLPVCKLPGFTRGLCFVKNHALVGLSKIREKHILETPLTRDHHTNLMAGVAVVDIASREQVGMLEFVRGGREVFDVVFLPKIRRPRMEEI